MRSRRLAGITLAVLGTAAAILPMRDAQCVEPIPAGTCIDLFSEPLDAYQRVAFGSASSVTFNESINIAGVSENASITFTLVGATRGQFSFDFGGGDTFTVGVDMTPVSSTVMSMDAADSFVGTGDFAGATADIHFSRTDGQLGYYVSQSPSTDGPHVLEFALYGEICMPDVPPPTEPGGGGHTPGFWQNRNGQALIDDADLAALRALHLVNPDGSAFDPTTKAAVKHWIRARAVNMAYKLSSMLAAMKLNVLNGFVNDGALVYCDTSVDPSGQISIHDLMAAADAALAADALTPVGDPNRPYQAALKDALDDANNNLNWVNP